MAQSSPHPFADAAETHISAVLFAGDLAYKQLKPVTTAFLDFATVEARGAALARELELNARLAPDVYLGTLAVLAGGEVIDHLLVMRRMPAERRLASLLRTAEGADALRAVAKCIAAFHAGLAPDDRAAQVASIAQERTRWRNNLEEMAELPLFDPESLARISSMVDRYLDGRSALFEQRARAGMARDGHGDLLAEDIFVLPDGPRVLDCLAFDDQLRIGDVLADIAFLIMDVERLAGERAAASLMRWYQEFANEHHPASLAHFYVAYRALVRAKIAALTHAQTEHPDDRDSAFGHLAQALAHLERSRLRVILVGGGPGTGKTTLADGVGSAMRAPVLTTDEIRKGLAGLSATEPAPAAPDQGLYTPDMTEQTYGEMLEEAERLLEHGESVVLDASWSAAPHREAARAMAARLGADVVELVCVLDTAMAKERVIRRSASPWTVSDATPEIVEHMASITDPWPEAMEIDTTEAPPICRAHALRHVLGLDEGALDYVLRVSRFEARR